MAVRRSHFEMTIEKTFVKTRPLLGDSRVSVDERNLKRFRPSLKYPGREFDGSRDTCPSLGSIPSGRFRQLSVVTPARPRHFPRDNSSSFPYN